MHAGWVSTCVLHVQLQRRRFVINIDRDRTPPPPKHTRHSLNISRDMSLPSTPKSTWIRLIDYDTMIIYYFISLYMSKHRDKRAVGIRGFAVTTVRAMPQMCQRGERKTAVGLDTEAGLNVTILAGAPERNSLLSDNTNTLKVSPHGFTFVPILHRSDMDSPMHQG